MPHHFANDISVLLVDDHAVVREGYRRLLETQTNIKVVGEATNGLDAVVLFGALTPDVVVMDIALPGITGIETLRRMLTANTQARVLMFSMYEEAIYANRALQAGAFGYVTKASAPDVLLVAVQTVANGNRYLSPDIAQELALRSITTQTQVPSRLSDREHEVLQLLVQGMPLREIAVRLGLSTKTVANHQSVLKHKLGAETAVQLARLGAELLQRPYQPPST
jgi:DNA-binding NarL/FixJ family response regulator